METLTPDAWWDGLGIASREDFGRYMPVLSCEHRFPGALHDRLAMLRRLVEFSYYDHTLLDVAAEYTFVTFELGLRVRYRELTGRSHRPSLNRLVRWAREQGLLDAPEAADALAKLRNELLHPSDKQVLGILVPTLISRVVDAIDCLYGDPRSVARRIELATPINRFFAGVSQRGAVLALDNGAHEIVLAWTLHVDISTTPTIYYLLFWPSFDPTPKDNTVNEGTPLIVQCNAIELGHALLAFRQASGENGRLTLKPVGDRRHAEWRRKFDTGEFPLRVAIDAHVSRLQSEVRRMIAHERKEGAQG